MDIEPCPMEMILSTPRINDHVSSVNGYDKLLGFLSLQPYPN